MPKKKTTKKKTTKKIDINEHRINDKNLTYSIEEGDAFLGHELSVNFNPFQFILDFKCVTPRIDVRSKDNGPVLNIKHNVVVVDPFHAKQFLALYARAIKRFEDEFGTIEKPKAIVAAEKKMKKLKKKESKKSLPTPSYFG